MIIKKITVGFVIQSFDTEKGKFISQEFIALDQVDYEDEKGNIATWPPSNDEGEPYLDFDMVQPKQKEVHGGID